MNEERMLILKMLEEGKINASEAAALLKALEVNTPDPTPISVDETSDENAHEVVSDIKQRLQQIKESIDNSYEKVKTKINAEQIPKEVESMVGTLQTGISRVISEIPKVINRIRSIDFGGGWLYSLDKSYSGTLKLDQPAQINITTVDGSIQVEAVDSPTYRVVATVKTPRFYESEAFSKVVQNHLSWEATENSFSINANSRYITDIKAQIPRHGEYILHLHTEDGSIRCQGIKGPSLHAETCDGNIRLTKIGLESVYANTVDGNVRGQDLKTNTLDAETVDGNINIHGKVSNAQLRTTDGSIKVSSDTDERITQSEWNLVSEDGSININLPYLTEAGYDLDLTSGIGSVKMDLNNLGGQQIQEKERFTFISSDYENKPFRFRVKARTQDGSISVHKLEK